MLESIAEKIKTSLNLEKSLRPEKRISELDIDGVYAEIGRVEREYNVNVSKINQLQRKNNLLAVVKRELENQLNVLFYAQDEIYAEDNLYKAYDEYPQGQYSGYGKKTPQQSVKNDLQWP